MATNFQVDPSSGSGGWGEWSGWILHDQHQRHYRECEHSDGRKQFQWHGGPVEMIPAPSEDRPRDFSPQATTNAWQAQQAHPSIPHQPSTNLEYAPHSRRPSYPVAGQPQYNVLSEEAGYGADTSSYRQHQAHDYWNQLQTYGHNQSGYIPTTTAYAPTNQALAAGSSGRQRGGQRNTRTTYMRGINDGKEYDPLDPAYRRVKGKNLGDFFKVGRVFSVLWTEPLGQVDTGGQSFTRYRESAHTEIRRFVIVITRDYHSLCVPISTYNKNGVRNKIDASNHAIAYTTARPPQPLAGESLHRHPIYIEITNENDTLDPASRINFGKVYTVEHNLKVKKIGKVTGDNLEWVRHYYTELNSVSHSNEGDDDDGDDEEEYED